MYLAKLHYLPVIIFLWFILTFIGLYAIAVALKDVNPVFPYISDTGTFTPESCLFGQLINVGSILLAIVIYLRYRQIKEAITERPSTMSDKELNFDKYRRLNATCLYLGWIAAFGVGIVANFQETVLFTIHLVGAVLAFGLAAVYQCLMWKISVRLKKLVPATDALNFVRGACSIISLITFFLCFGFASIALMQFKGKDITKWGKDDGGYVYHLASTITEWICAVFTMTFILTYHWDFKQFRLEEPRIEFIE